MEGGAEEKSSNMATSSLFEQLLFPQSSPSSSRSVSMYSYRCSSTFKLFTSQEEDSLEFVVVVGVLLLPCKVVSSGSN